MQLITCPKCGKEQPVTSRECVQCGVIFNKLLQHKAVKKEKPPVVHEAPVTAAAQKNFLPEIGLKRNL